MDNISLFHTDDVRYCTHDRLTFKRIITDRKSIYTVSGGVIDSKDAVKQRIKTLLQNKSFQKATHNTYAWRFVMDDGAVVEGKNDDGETGAGMCILRTMKKANIVNCVIVVTRYFGGIQLHAERFRHVVDATQYFLDESK